MDDIKPNSITPRQAEASWNDACTSAFHEIRAASGKDLARLAEDFRVNAVHLKRVVEGGANAPRWSLRLVISMAVASGQDPVRMLTRESLP